MLRPLIYMSLLEKTYPTNNGVFRRVTRPLKPCDPFPILMNTHMLSSVKLITKKPLENQVNILKNVAFGIEPLLNQTGIMKQLP